MEYLELDPIKYFNRYQTVKQINNSLKRRRCQFIPSAGCDLKFNSVTRH